MRIKKGFFIWNVQKYQKKWSESFKVLYFSYVIWWFHFFYWTFNFTSHILYIWKPGTLLENIVFFLFTGPELSLCTREDLDFSINFHHSPKILIKPLQLFENNWQICIIVFINSSLPILILKLVGFICYHDITSIFLRTFWYQRWFQQKNLDMSGFSETFLVSDRYFGPKMAKNEVSILNW